MNKEEIEAKLEFEKVSRNTALRAEFEKLRPSQQGMTIRVVLGMIVIAFVLWLYPSFNDDSPLMLLLILIVGLSGDIYRESIVINKRIDVLFQLLKNDE